MKRIGVRVGGPKEAVWSLFRTKNYDEEIKETIRYHGELINYPKEGFYDLRRHLRANGATASCPKLLRGVVSKLTKFIFQDSSVTTFIDKNVFAKTQLETLVTRLWQCRRRTDIGTRTKRLSS